MNQPKQLYLDLRLEAHISLDNFIECDSTKLIIVAVKDFISRSRGTKNFFLWGNPGVGKNYLLHSVNREFLKEGLHSAYITFEDNLIKEPSLLEGLENVDVVFIESIDKLNFGSDWELAFFNLINTCNLNNTNLFFSSSKPSKDLRINLPDLQSRLNFFTAFELPEISDEEKFLALKESALRKGLSFEDKTLTYILNHTSRKLSDLLSLISDLDTFSLEKKKKITIPLVKELFFSKEGSQDT